MIPAINGGAYTCWDEPTHRLLSAGARGRLFMRPMGGGNDYAVSFRCIQNFCSYTPDRLRIAGGSFLVSGPKNIALRNHQYKINTTETKGFRCICT